MRCERCAPTSADVRWVNRKCVCSGASHQRSHTLLSFYVETHTASCWGCSASCSCSVPLTPVPAANASHQRRHRSPGSADLWASGPEPPLPSSDWPLLRYHGDKRSNNAKLREGVKTSSEEAEPRTRQDRQSHVRLPAHRKTHGLIFEAVITPSAAVGT